MSNAFLTRADLHRRFAVTPAALRRRGLLPAPVHCGAVWDAGEVEAAIQQTPGLRDRLRTTDEGERLLHVALNDRHARQPEACGVGRVVMAYARWLRDHGDEQGYDDLSCWNLFPLVRHIMPDHALRHMLTALDAANRQCQRRMIDVLNLYDVVIEAYQDGHSWTWGGCPRRAGRTVVALCVRHNGMVAVDVAVAPADRTGVDLGRVWPELKPWPRDERHPAFRARLLAWARERLASYSVRELHNIAINRFCDYQEAQEEKRLRRLRQEGA